MGNNEVPIIDFLGDGKEPIYSIENQEEIIREIVGKHISGLEIEGSKIEYAKNKDEFECKSIIISLDGKNAKIGKSDYFSGKGTEMVHFTSYNTLEKILANPVLRLYNLHNLNDPREFEFANNIFNINNLNNDKILEDAKENLFISSFCKPIIFRNDSSTEFNMWRLYGHDKKGVEGNGVAIKFKVMNDPRELTDFHIANIQYGHKNRIKFQRLIEEIKNDPRITLNVFYDFGKLNIFHKSILFKLENEVRIVFDRRKFRTGPTGVTISDNTGNDHFPVFHKDPKKVNSKYFELDLYSKKNKDGILIFDYINREQIPLLKLVEIKFGFKCDYNISKIEELAMESLGYIPIMKPTKIKKFYWGK